MRLMLSDEDLLSRLGATEDHFVERKSAGDSKDWLKTVVALANSTPIGLPAVLFIGVKNDGTVEEGTNLDSLQRSFNKKIESAYPSIPVFPKIIGQGGKECLAVIVPGSEGRPHFAGPSYIRHGSERRAASEEQFRTLIAERNSKARRILEWKDKTVTVDILKVEEVRRGRVAYSKPGTVVDCDQFFVTLQIDNNNESFPLKRVELSYDNQQDRLKLEVYPL